MQGGLRLRCAECAEAVRDARGWVGEGGERASMASLRRCACDSFVHCRKTLHSPSPSAPPSVMAARPWQQGSAAWSCARPPKGAKNWIHLDL